MSENNKFKVKIERREKKNKRKMKVDGSGVKKLQKIILNNIDK